MLVLLLLQKSSRHREPFSLVGLMPHLFQDNDMVEDGTNHALPILWPNILNIGRKCRMFRQINGLIDALFRRREAFQLAFGANGARAEAATAVGANSH